MMPQSPSAVAYTPSAAACPAIATYIFLSKPQSQGLLPQQWVRQINAIVGLLRS